MRSDQIWQYLHHLRRAKGKHGIHSPFVFEFVTQVLPHHATATQQRIAALRKRCATSKDQLQIQDFGAGYGGDAQPMIQKTMQDIVRSSARGHREGTLLSRICKHYAPAQVLELGTNLGFSSLYLSAGLSPDAELITVEGSKELSRIAANHFTEMGYAPRQLVAEFSSALEEQIDWASFKPNLVLLDGNHREEATLTYFAFLLPRLAQGAILILDDIYWSVGMTAAWKAICAHPRVSVSIDLFALGICFLDRPQAKEHFNIRFRAW
jgi:predicted O-methyltransferase YrrM